MADTTWLLEAIHWMLQQSAECHGCFTGDCPHWKHSECVEFLAEQFWQSGPTVEYQMPMNLVIDKPRRHGILRPYGKDGPDDAKT